MKVIKTYYLTESDIISLEKQKKNFGYTYVRIGKRSKCDWRYVCKVFNGKYPMPNYIYNTMVKMGFKFNNNIKTVKKYLFEDFELDMIKDQMIDMSLTYEKVGNLCNYSRSSIFNVFNGFQLVNDNLYNELKKIGFKLNFRLTKGV